MWKKLKEVLSSKPKIVANSLLSQHGEVVDDLADIADIFNEHFSTVGERLVSNATPRGLVDDSINLTRINSLEEKCTLPDITEEYVQKQISAMAVGKATGPDGISVKMLQIASRYIIRSLTHVFNLSIRGEHYPKDWKYTLVTPTRPDKTMRSRDNTIIATWNVRTLSQVGKLKELTHELENYN